MNVGRLELICIRRDATRPRAQRTNGSWRASSGRRRRVNSTIILLLLLLLFISIIITIIVLSYMLPVAKLCTRYMCAIYHPLHDPPHTPSTLTPPPPAALVTSCSLHCLIYFFIPPCVPSFVLGLHTMTDLYLRSILFSTDVSDRSVHCA